MLSENGKSFDEVMTELRALKSEDPRWSEGRTFSLVYYLGEEHRRLLSESYSLFMFENALNPVVFRSAKRMEDDVVSASLKLMNAPEGGCGVMTSGGTESLMLAVLAYRERARVQNPELVMPESAHVTLIKACEFFGVRVRLAALDSAFRADRAHMRELVNSRTIALVASAPQYPHGVIDPISEIGKLALEKRIPFHVDACLGGFLLPFLEKNGATVPAWDFRVDGVTSISADLHKYGYAPKGASVVLYRSMDYMKHQFFVYENWPGGIYASAGMQGTRSVGAIAGAWAVLNRFGESGYRNLAAVTMATTRKLIEGIRAVPGLEILGEPAMSAFAYRSVDPSVSTYALADELERRGWVIDRQQNPECLHATVTPVHASSADAFLKDLAESVAHVRAHPEAAAKGRAAVYGMISKMPLRGLVRGEVEKSMRKMYSGEPIDLNKPPGFIQRLVLSLLSLWARIART